MQFFVHALDGTDPGAPQRRQENRAAHLALARQMHQEKRLLSAAALLNEAGGMVGSVLLVEFPSRGALEETWLQNEPYCTGKVWETIQITPCRLPDFCL